MGTDGATLTIIFPSVYSPTSGAIQEEVPIAAVICVVCSKRRAVPKSQI